MPRVLGVNSRRQCRFTSSDSATTDRALPGPNKRAIVKTRCMKNIARSRSTYSSQLNRCNCQDLAISRIYAKNWELAPHRVTTMTAASRAIWNEPGAMSQSVKHTLSPLPYDSAALEPVIDCQSVLLHYAGYAEKFNAALEVRCCRRICGPANVN